MGLETTRGREKRRSLRPSPKRLKNLWPWEAVDSHVHLRIAGRPLALDHLGHKMSLLHFLSLLDGYDEEVYGSRCDLPIDSQIDLCPFSFMAECVEDISTLAFIGQQIQFVFQRVESAEDAYVSVCMCL